MTQYVSLPYIEYCRIMSESATKPSWVFFRDKPPWRLRSFKFAQYIALVSLSFSMFFLIGFSTVPTPNYTPSAKPQILDPKP